MNDDDKNSMAKQTANTQTTDINQTKLKPFNAIRQRAGEAHLKHILQLAFDWLVSRYFIFGN